MSRRTLEVQGSIRIREHCTFIWRQPESAYQRIVDVGPEHCTDCVAYLAQQGGFILHDRRQPGRFGGDG